jgi:ATP-dependent helicase/nuclease subunit B
VKIEFVLGPAGSGKTRWCVDRAREVLRGRPEGVPLIFLTPKQSTFQLERQLLASPDLAGFTRLQIVSFDRLALFLLDHFGLPEPEVLSEEGRVMVLRSLLLRQASNLTAFQASARTAGFARALSGWLRELQQHHATPHRLRSILNDPVLPGPISSMAARTQTPRS